ncbi:MAG: glycosyltransferase family 4 protein, partial [Chloroflexi bacterium]|nr:glycosyltransferase family 4 protein [Chloroflexota bacterium]
MTTRILSDVLPLQIEPTRHRGIGQYTAKVLHGLARQGAEGQAHLFLGSGHLAQPEPFPSGGPGRWRLYYGDYPLGRYRPDQWAYHLEGYGSYWQKQLDRFRPQVLHIHSPFEWDAPLHRHHAGTPTVYTVYDLIPLRLEEHYLRKAPLWMQSGYRHVCELLRRADHLITISQHSRQDIIELLGIEPERISVAPAGPSGQFARAPDPRVMASLRGRLPLGNGFVISTAGFDYRKNLKRMLESYSLLDRRLRQAHPLVVVCALTSEEEGLLRSQARELGIEANLVLTNYVSDDELLALYHMATVQFLPSIYEGFGLPVLDAMLCGLPVITSNASSLPEVAGEAALLVDPLDTKAMADALTRVLESEGLRAELRAKGLEQAKRFDWEQAARVFQEVYRQVGGSDGWAFFSPVLRREAPKLESLAFVSPLPPQVTGVADFAAYLIQALRQHVSVTAFVAPEQVSAARHRVEAPVESIAALPGMVTSGQVDAVL